MKFFKSKYVKYFIIFGIFAIGFALVYKNWYFSFKPITNGDLGFLYRDFFIELFHTLSPPWNSGVNFGGNAAPVLNYFGYNFWGGIFALLGFDWNHILRFIFLYPILIGFTISTLLVSRLFKSNPLIGLLFGFIFSINTFIFAWLNVMVAYALLPIVIVTLFIYLKSNKFLYLLLFSLIFSLAVFYEIRVGFITFLLSTIFAIFYWLYYPISKKIFIKQFISFVCSFIIIFFLGAFFVFPLFHSEGFSTISTITSQNLFGIQFYKLQYSLSFMQPYWNGEMLKVFSLQPLKFYFWLYPVFAFSALFFAKKDKKIIYFSSIAIFGIFMGKSANIPFGGIYAWAYHHLPFFNFFREPLEWWVITGFSYAILIAYFFYYFYQEIEKVVKRKFHKGIFISNFAKILITIPMVLVLLSIAIPAYDGRLGHGLNPVAFAQEYESLRQLLLKDKSFYRTLSIPTNQRFTYYSNNHPYVAFNYLPDTLKSLDPKLLSLESIRYIILPDDVLTDVFANTYNKLQFENFIQSSESSEGYQPLQEIKGFGNIKMWENPNDIPHFMAVKDLVYIIGSQDIANVIGIPTSKQVAYYSEQNIPLDISKKTREILTKENDTIYKNATKIYSVADCIRCDLSKKYLDYVQFPFARFLPGDLLYPLIEIKDNRTLKTITSPEEKFKMDAFFVEKRALEIQQMKEKPFDNTSYIMNTFIRANNLLDDMEEKYNEMDKAVIDNGFLQTWDYLYTERRTFDDLYQQETDKQISDVLSKITYRLDDLITKLSQKVWITQGDDKKLISNISEDGNYKILMKNDEEGDLANSQLAINGKNFQKATTVDNGFLNFGNYQLTKGQYFLKLTAPSVNLLDLSSFQGDIVEANSIRIVSLKDAGAAYQLSFDYKITGGRSGRIFISDDAFPRNFNALNGNLIYNSALQSHNNEQWYHLSVFFSPYSQIKNPVLHLRDENEESGAIFRNLSLTKVITPTIILVKDTGKVLDTPHITYQEVTPTDYVIRVENAKSPFLLSFSEQYDGNWTALSTSKQNFFGKNSLVASYFDNNVNELDNVNKIEPKVLVDSFLSNRIDSLHIGLNGFSNGWFINKNGTYQMHITFSPQKYFLIGLAVSALALIAVLSAIVYLLVKKRKK